MNEFYVVVDVKISADYEFNGVYKDSLINADLCNSECGGFDKSYVL